MTPKVLAVALETFGALKTGWFSVLKVSKRSCR